MLAFLPNLLGHSDKALGTLMHIGAGVGAELATYESLRIKTIIAIESDNTLFQKLQTKARRYQNVVAINNWVADNDEERKAYKVSNSRFNSLLEPIDLFSKFTNLKTISNNLIKPIAISDLVRERVEASSTQRNILVLDIQGFESSLLSGCAKVELHKFDWVFIRSSEHALYQSALSKTQLIKMIYTLGYELVLSDESNAPFVEYYFRLNREGITNKELEVKLHSNGEYIEQLLATVNDLNSRIDMAQKQYDEQTAFLKQAREFNTEQSELLKSLQNDLKNSNEALDKLSEGCLEKNEKIADLEVAVSKLRQKTSEVQKQKQDNEEFLSLAETKLQKQSELKEQMEFDKQSLQSALSQSKKDSELIELELERVKEENTKTLRAQEDIQSQLSKLNEDNEAQKQQLIDSKLIIIANKQRQESDEHQISKLITQKSELEIKLDKMSKNLEQQTHWHHENKKWRGKVSVEKEKLELAYNKLQKHASEIETSNETNVSKLNSQIMSLENDLKQYKTWVENLKKEIEKLGIELKNKSGNIDLGQMMLAKSNLDLEHLRESYNEKVASEKVLVDLIAELRQKLLQASKYYFQLQKEHPELLSPSKNLESD